MKVIFLIVLISIFNYFFITTIVDIVLMGKLHIKFLRKLKSNEFIIKKENRIDIQKRYECYAYSSAYVMRHW